VLLVGHSKDQHMAASVFAAELPPKFSHERLTVKEVAERLRVHPWTIYMWARSGRLPCIRLSKRTLRFLESDIAKYEKLHTSGPIR
jgi:excisionase family DNA binding protein